MLEVGRLYKESSRGENKKYMQRVIAKKEAASIGGGGGRGS
jgi:hypothetical protein